ncbi:MAG TPA: hypothetical protein VMU68_11555 [Acidimicrobiales bacterium]|nr:hypothetical protein [Acidimicrobiales bacterium]
MKAYRFSLHTVLRIRGLEERLARERLVVASRAVHQAEDTHRAREVVLAQLVAPPGVVTMNELHWVADQAARQAERILSSRQALIDAALARDEARRAWYAARQRASVLERLQAQGLARWKEEVQRKMGLELDDLTNARHGYVGASQ